VRRTSDPDKVKGLRSLGCELAIGDLKEPPQIEAACKGITAVISTASSTLSRQQGDSIESVDLQGQLALVNAARTAGIRRFVYASFRDDPTLQYPLTKAKRSVELAIADLDFTSIQASWFMEVWLSPALGFDYVHGKVRLYGSGSKPISWVSYRDVAEFCIAPVLRSVGSRSMLAVGGPEALTALEVVRIFEEEWRNTKTRNFQNGVSGSSLSGADLYNWSIARTFSAKSTSTPESTIQMLQGYPAACASNRNIVAIPNQLTTGFPPNGD